MPLKAVPVQPEEPVAREAWSKQATQHMTAARERMAEAVAGIAAELPLTFGPRQTVSSTRAMIRRLEAAQANLASAMSELSDIVTTSHLTAQEKP